MSGLLAAILGLAAAAQSPEASADASLGPSDTAPQTRVHARADGPDEKKRTRRGPAVSSTLLLGSGVSMAPGPVRAQANRSPLMLTLDAGFFHPELTWLEFSPAAMLEVERGVGFGLAFRVRAFLPTRRLRPYGTAGLSYFFAPYKLFGAQAGVGLALRLHEHFALATELAPTVFFFGNDLTAGGVLAKIDGSVGLRVSF